MKKQQVSFVQEHSIAIVSTSDNSDVYGAPIYYQFEQKENSFYFLTFSNTQKHANIEENKKAFLTIFNENPPTVFTAHCVGELLDSSKVEYSDIMLKLVAIHSSRECYPTPLATMKDGEVSLIRLNVESTEFKAYKVDIDLLRA